MCPSTQPTAGARSPCGATDDRAAGGVTSLPTRRAAAYLHCRHAAQRRIFTFHTPRSGVSSLSTRCAAACDLTPHTPRSGVRLHFPHPAQRHVPSLLTRRAAACVFTPHTPRSGVRLHFPPAAAFICTCRAAEGRLGGVGWGAGCGAVRCGGLGWVGADEGSVRGARTSSSHCRGLHLHFPPLSDPQATTSLSPPGGIYLIANYSALYCFANYFANFFFDGGDALAECDNDAREKELEL